MPSPPAARRLFPGQCVEVKVGRHYTGATVDGPEKDGWVPVQLQTGRRIRVRLDLLRVPWT